MALYSAKVVVTGKVQDVSFRSFIKRNADTMGLKGFVRNRDDGKVEALIEGEKDMIEALIEAIRAGPERAIVKDVDIEWRPYSGIYTDFKVIY
ncbi:MAG: acylphosphatase [Candidatus Aenigmarchaeota archaeon]|nr:acylphosphatase [Candidatus Aenigmarchaeota archaeon]